MVEGEDCVVFLYFDEESERVVGTTKINRYLEREDIELKIGEEVELMVVYRFDLGYNAIINGKYSGVLYESDVFQKLKRGQKIKGYIKKIRADQKIDLTLAAPGYKKVDGLSQQILDKLELQDGFLPIHSKTPPETISSVFKVSKKAYKMAIGSLYKQRLITIDEDGIRLIK